jgi:phenylacetic acid degradation operon negative regulatory protein
MKPKTEEFLYLMLWAADVLTHPTFRNLTDSYETWAYRSGLRRQSDVLERQGFLESKPGQGNERLCRLTEKGRLHALGGRDPAACWGRRWDGKWRLVVFDFPAGQSARRRAFWRYLRHNRFGYLQNSAWISPDPLGAEREALAGGDIDVGSLVLFEARPCGDESDAEIAAGAWDFDLINQRYAEHGKVLAQRPTGAPVGQASSEALRSWAARERVAWSGAVSIDPLLPQALLPKGYLGQKAWRRRIEVLRQAGRQIRAFAQR